MAEEPFNPYAPPPPGQAPPPPPPPPPGYGPPDYGQPVPYGYGAPYGQAPASVGPPSTGDDPRAALLTAAKRLQAASVLLWVLTAVWLLGAGAGGFALRAQDELEQGEVFSAISSTDAMAAMVGLLLLLVLPLGGALWALLALWTSWTARAARAVGRGRETGLSHLAWWGLFVPLAAVVLPVLAYSQAARFARSARHGGAGSVPGLLVGFWVLAICALTLTLAAVGVTEEFGEIDPELGTQGALLVLGGLLGVASGVTGALACRRVARDAREAAQR